MNFLTEITYEYRHDTNANEPIQGFAKVNPLIFAKKPYSLVRDLPFADNPITTYYPWFAYLLYSDSNLINMKSVGRDNQKK